MNKKLEVLSHYKTVLKAEQYVIAGSMAMALMGFEHKVTDLDILLYHPEQETLEILKALEIAHPSSKGKLYPSKDLFKFSHDGEDLDVFIINGRVKTHLHFADGIDISPVENIVAAKLSYNRPKDYFQLQRWSNVLMTDEAFDKFLSERIGKSSSIYQSNKFAPIKK